MEEKMEGKSCQRCDKPLAKSWHKKLCLKCLKALPQCWSCGIICGSADWDFLVEKEAKVFIVKKTGKEIVLCGGCQVQLETGNGYLRPKRKGISDEEKKVRREELIRKQS